MKRYLLFCTAAVALACVSCLSRNGDDALVSATDPTEKLSSSPQEPSGQRGW